MARMANRGGSAGGVLLLLTRVDLAVTGWPRGLMRAAVRPTGQRNPWDPDPSHIPVFRSVHLLRRHPAGGNVGSGDNARGTPVAPARRRWQQHSGSILALLD